MNQKVKFFTSKGYGVFPYIIIREMSGMYRQIPIHFLIEELTTKEGVLVELSGNESHEEIQDKCVEILRKIINSENVISSEDGKKDKWVTVGEVKREGCVVLNPSSAIYLNSEGEIISRTKKIPWGGTLISMNGETISQSESHFQIQ